MAAHSIEPWYRHRWPWLLMAGPALVVAAGVATAVIAVRTDDGVIAADYYKRGLEINATLERQRRAEALGIITTVRIAGDRVSVAFASREPAPPPARLKLVHPTRAGEDRAVLLQAVAPGTFAGSIGLPASGAWDVQLQDALGTWRMDGELKAGATSLELGTRPR